MKRHFFILITALYVLVPYSLYAQKAKTKYKKGDTILLKDTLTTYNQSDIFHFPNIGKVYRYYDEKKLERINKFKTENREKERYQLLKEYVRSFGVNNFTKDIFLLVDFAKLSRTYGPPGEAILLYKLILKHIPNELNGRQIRSEFDTLNRRKADLFVPIQQYYKLVEYRKEVDTLRPPHGVLLNMGYNVNSVKEDYGPTIGNADNILLFTSKRNSYQDAERRTYNEDLFFTIRRDSMWTHAEAFKNINTRYNEGSACISLDGKHLYFARCNSPDSNGNCDIYVADYQADSTWGNVRNLGLLINSKSWDSQPSLSHSGDTLFFASDRIGGFGYTDIYYSVKGKDGKWQKAINAGPVINTKGFEVSPFFHHRFNVLYFSSTGQPLNFGSFDIYKAYRFSKSWGEPKNIGPLVNGPGSEYYFTIDSASRVLYYARSSEEQLHDLDLHSFPVPMEAQPEAVVTLKGSLTNSQTKQPMQGIVAIIDLDKGVEVAPKFLREDGSFDFELINKRNYLLIIQGDDFFRIEELFFLDGEREMNLETAPIEPKLAFKSLEFEYAKSDILPGMRPDLEKLANFMVDHPHVKLQISGHTDSAGKEETNLTLSQARADSIKRYLVDEFKIDGARIEAHGYGSARPIVPNEKTEDDRKLNRRVEFEIVK